MEKDFDELTIADDIAKQCTSCTFFNSKFSLTSKLVADLHHGHPCPF